MNLTQVDEDAVLQPDNVRLLLLVRTTFRLLQRRRHVAVVVLHLETDLQRQQAKDVNFVGGERQGVLLVVCTCKENSTSHTRK